MLPLRFVLLLLFLTGARAYQLRDTNLRVTDPIARGIEITPGLHDSWRTLLLYTAPFDKSVSAQAALIVQFDSEMRIHNYRHLCEAYGKAAGKASARLAARPETKSLLRNGQPINADVAERLCIAHRPSAAVARPSPCCTRCAYYGPAFPVDSRRSDTHSHPSNTHGLFFCVSWPMIAPIHDNTH